MLTCLLCPHLAAFTGRDILWYTREKAGNSELSEEIRAVQEREKQLMLEVCAPALHKPFYESLRLHRDSHPAVLCVEPACLYC